MPEDSSSQSYGLFDLLRDLNEEIESYTDCFEEIELYASDAKYKELHQDLLLRVLDDNIKQPAKEFNIERQAQRYSQMFMCLLDYDVIEQEPYLQRFLPQTFESSKEIWSIFPVFAWNQKYLANLMLCLDGYFKEFVWAYEQVKSEYSRFENTPTKSTGSNRKWGLYSVPRVHQPTLDLDKIRPGLDYNITVPEVTERLNDSSIVFNLTDSFLQDSAIKRDPLTDENSSPSKQFQVRRSSGSQHLKAPVPPPSTTRAEQVSTDSQAELYAKYAKASEQAALLKQQDEAAKLAKKNSTLTPPQPNITNQISMVSVQALSPEVPFYKQPIQNYTSGKKYQSAGSHKQRIEKFTSSPYEIEEFSPGFDTNRMKAELQDVDLESVRQNSRPVNNADNNQRSPTSDIKSSEVLIDQTNTNIVYSNLSGEQNISVKEKNRSEPSVNNMAVAVEVNQFKQEKGTNAWTSRRSAASDKMEIQGVEDYKTKGYHHIEPEYMSRHTANHSSNKNIPTRLNFDPSRIQLTPRIKSSE